MIVAAAGGAVEGAAEDQGYCSFKNIPYAQVPGRFLPPTEAACWQGVRDCTEYGKYCPQIINGIVAGKLGSVLSSPAVSDEYSCLNLNVYTPAPDGAKRPVFVYLPVGAFIMGYHNDLLNHRPLVTDYDCVVVTFNIRVGVLGFFQVDQYLGEKYIQSGNNGLLDAVMACRWVKRNIAAFGGDPDNITLMGGSAGAMAIASLLLLPEFAGLVNKVIMQSGSANRMRDLPTAHALADRLFPLYGIDPQLDPQAAAGLLHSSLPELSRHWAEYQMNQGGITRHHYLAPVFDGVTFGGSDALEMIRAGQYCSDVSILGGYCKDEYCGFIMSGVDYTDPAVAAEYFLNRADVYLANLQRLVPEGNADFDGMVAFCTDYFYANGMRRTYDTIASVYPESNIYFYRFDWDYLETRANHGLDFSFTRGGMILTPGIERHPKFQPFADKVMHMFMNFVRSGNPNLPDKPADWPDWPRYTAQDKKIYGLDVSSKVITAPPVVIEPNYMHIIGLQP